MFNNTLHAYVCYIMCHGVTMSRCLTQECLLLQYRPEHNHVCQQGRRFGSKWRRHLCEGVPSEEWECGPIGAIRDRLYPGQGDSARYAHVRTYTCGCMHSSSSMQGIVYQCECVPWAIHLYIICGFVPVALQSQWVAQEWNWQLRKRQPQVSRYVHTVGLWRNV